MHDLFSVAMYLKDQLATASPVLESWPPTACDLTDKVIEKSVPSELFKFLA